GACLAVAVVARARLSPTRQLPRAPAVAAPFSCAASRARLAGRRANPLAAVEVDEEESSVPSSSWLDAVRDAARDLLITTR
ncbi:unnamed protein product, partial [Urochloa humidicola]